MVESDYINRRERWRGHSADFFYIQPPPWLRQDASYFHAASTCDVGMREFILLRRFYSMHVWLHVERSGCRLHYSPWRDVACIFAVAQKKYHSDSAFFIRPGRRLEQIVDAGRKLTVSDRVCICEDSGESSMLFVHTLWLRRVLWCVYNGSAFDNGNCKYLF